MTATVHNEILLRANTPEGISQINELHKKYIDVILNPTEMLFDKLCPLKGRSPVDAWGCEGVIYQDGHPINIEILVNVFGVEDEWDEDNQLVALDNSEVLLELVFDTQSKAPTKLIEYLHANYKHLSVEAICDAWDDSFFVLFNDGEFEDIRHRLINN